ncbi:MAG: hypothetical protein AB1611_01210 [bacterium]
MELKLTKEIEQVKTSTIKRVVPGFQRLRQRQLSPPVSRIDCFARQDHFLPLITIPYLP